MDGPPRDRGVHGKQQGGWHESNRHKASRTGGEGASPPAPLDPAGFTDSGLGSRPGADLHDHRLPRLVLERGTRHQRPRRHRRRLRRLQRIARVSAPARHLHDDRRPRRDVYDGLRHQQSGGRGRTLHRCGRRRPRLRAPARPLQHDRSAGHDPQGRTDRPEPPPSASTISGESSDFTMEATESTTDTSSIRTFSGTSISRVPLRREPSASTTSSGSPAATWRST